ncbi:acetate--CoA ligase family protein [Cupriavidus basilensis]
MACQWWANRWQPSEDAAVRAANACGYPVVLKVESPAIPHKSEAGVIRLGVRSAGKSRPLTAR